MQDLSGNTIKGYQLQTRWGGGIWRGVPGHQPP